MDQEYKIVHKNIFKPHNSIFKSGAKERAEVQTVSCCNSANCGLLERGECSFVAPLSCVRCPYGRYNRYTGFTRRASKYSQWIKEQEDKFNGVQTLSWHSQRMAVVGDYVFLPYSHMTMNKNIPFLAHDTMFVGGNCFLPSKEFTVANIVLLVRYKPQAFLGEEITSYQKEVPPKFLKHLSEQMPELFHQVIATDEYAEQRFNEFSNVGRKAVLETLTPNIGEFEDIHGGLWKWDGELLKSNNSHASFMLVNKFSELTMRPKQGQSVTITDERQVNDNTVFVGS